MSNGEGAKLTDVKLLGCAPHARALNAPQSG